MVGKNRFSGLNSVKSGDCIFLIIDFSFKNGGKVKIICQPISR